MRVQVTRIDQIPAGTDHTYDGEGFGILFEVEGDRRKEKVSEDEDMKEADPDVDPNADGKKDEQNKNSEKRDQGLHTSSATTPVQNSSAQNFGKQVVSLQLKR